MSKAFLDISVSLDGFIAGPKDSRDQPLGTSGDRLHEWIWNGTPGRWMQGGTVATTGAVVVGRRTYDLVDGWGGSHPLPGVPAFVVTREVPKKVPKGSTQFTFVTEGVAPAIAQARAAAGAKDVYVIGGGSIARQSIRGGALDELRLHIVPVLLGDGVRLFDGSGEGLLEFEHLEVGKGRGVTHLRLGLVGLQGRRRKA
jgi:dihydrofolate reductase